MKKLLSIFAVIALCSCEPINPLGPQLPNPNNPNPTGNATLHVRVYCQQPDSFVKRVSGNVYYSGQTYSYYNIMRDTFISAQIVLASYPIRVQNDLICKYTSGSFPNDPLVDILVWVE